ncbi:MAG TPA: sugar ABC transporter permease [Gemmatimonadales bacterium]|nr:sugar ABC transporter permease [Gemmatimonadales bacterium]
MSSRFWAAGATIAAAVAAALALVAVHVAQRHYERAFAFRMARTTAAYVVAVTPPPPPPPPPRRVPRARQRSGGQPAPAASSASRSYYLPALLTHARALETLPGWSSDVEVYFGTAPLVEATAPPLTPNDLALLATGGRRRDGAALVPLKDRVGEEIVGAVAIRPRPMPRGPFPGGMGFAVPAAILAVGAATAIAFRQRPMRRGGYVMAALLLGLATYADVRAAARQSTDRWLVDTRRLLQEAAQRLPAPGARVTVPDLAAIVRESGGDAEVVAGEPAESAPRRVVIDGQPRAVVAVLVGPGRWVELRSVPGERATLHWLAVLMPCVMLGPVAILLLRWAERTPARRRRETAIAWGFLAPAGLHFALFTLGPALLAVYLAATADWGALAREPLTWIALRNSVLYAGYVPISVALALAAAVAVQRYRHQWTGRLLSAAFLLPYVVPVVTIALLWQAMYQRGSLGSGRPDWLSSSGTALLALMIVSVWAHVGAQMVVFLNGLESIPRAYLDAARLDGAGAWRGFWRVTLPLLKHVTWFVALTAVLGALQLFTLVFVLTQGGPGQSTDVLVHRIYRTAFESQGFATACALAVAFAVVLLVLRWPQLRLLRARMAGRVGRHA